MGGEGLQGRIRRESNGSAAELRIESRLDEGTAVTMLMPLACEEEEWNLRCGQDE